MGADKRAELVDAPEGTEWRLATSFMGGTWLHLVPTGAKLRDDKLSWFYELTDGKWSSPLEAEMLAEPTDARKVSRRLSRRHRWFGARRAERERIRRERANKRMRVEQEQWEALRKATGGEQ